MSDTRQLVVYLSGSVKKGKDDTKTDYWSADDRRLISETVGRVAFLDPSVRNDDLSDSLSTFGRDLFQVRCSDAVLVDARGRRGIGVGAEMMLAKVYGVPIISVVPANSHYARRDFEYLGQIVGDWVHPFVKELSDIIVPDVLGAARALAAVEPLGQRVPDVAFAEKAMRHYARNQMGRDVEVHEIYKERGVTLFLETLFDTKED